ncbi:hypothetical protein I317_06127 [Kwoniella heveanensis CBS 569]|nr:hypothetical protein I317_06127 [Kwoniella heveanensis CBS 569]
MSSAFSTTSSSPTSDTNSDPESASDKPMTTSTSKLFRTLLHSIRLRLPRQAHQILAYPLTLLLTSHVLTHRLIPQSSQPPISSLSPSELGWDFVGYNLQSAVSWLAYLGLVGAGVWHAAVGSMKVVSWLKSGRRARGRDTGVRGASVGTEEIASGEKEVVSSSTQETPAPAANGKGKTTASPIGNLPKPSEPTTSPPLNPTPSPKRPVVSRRRKFGLRSIIALFLGLISVGLYRVRSDTASYGISALMKRRYDAVFAAVPWAVLWLH